ncbi:hypothetical protein Glove_328g105 [Diversispora epigaea]|uniref:Uncharacterized protein n=1 Tax=Diversispora epigaea TaxID=1348612 RepID=A0A397HKU8_9GLOM|nr:hypothetical protein Glove_328g105 [Diversispora epigaea]
MAQSGAMAKFWAQLAKLNLAKFLAQFVLRLPSLAWGVAIVQLFLNPKRKLQNKLLLKPRNGELEAEQTTEEEFKE